MEFVQYAEDDGIAIISLDRPDARNAQHPPLLRELDECFDRAATDDGVRVIILRANGKHFSSGHDISPEGAAIWAREVLLANMVSK